MLISSVEGDAGNSGVTAVKEASTPAFDTSVVVPAMPANTDALALGPCSDTSAELVDDAGNFVTGNARILNSGPEAFFHKQIAVAGAASVL